MEIPSTRSARRCIVIGCGLAGPVLATFLRRAGIEAVVYESRPEPRDDVGAFLGLAPNGRNVLAEIGIRDRVEGVGMSSRRIAFLNHKGKQLGINPQPVVTFKRGVLNKALREAAVHEGVEVQWGKRLVAVDQDADSVCARFADGTSAEGDLLIGCDGINSSTREIVFPGVAGPEYTGVVGSGAYTRLRGLGPTFGTMFMTFCLKGFFGYQVDADGEIYWFENFYQARQPGPGELECTNEEWRRRLLGLHSADHEPITRIIAGTTMDIVRYEVHEMSPMETWHSGRVVLVGDAAHATGPHSGQGGSLAFEDSIVLAKALRDAPVGAALERYQSIRKERTEMIVKETRRTGNQKTPPGLLGRMIRDVALPIFLKKGVGTAKGIHDHKIEWDAA